jgi:hypothetical protein
MKRVGDLELDQSLGFERAELRVQRFAWKLMLLVIAGAILGVFGTGLLDQAVVHGDGIRVRYSRFERANRPSSLEITLTPESVQNGSVSVWLALDYARKFEITSITPAPDSAASKGDRVTCTFRANRNAPVTVVFHLRAGRGTFGIVGARMGAVSAGEVAFRQFIWP